MKEQATGYLDQSINEAAPVTGPIKNSEDPFSHHSGRAQTMTSDSDARNKGLSSWHPQIKSYLIKKHPTRQEMKKHAGDRMCLYLCPDYISPVIFKTISSKLKKKKNYPFP